MSLVVVYQQSTTSLIDEPQGRRGGAVPRGSRYAHLGAAGARASGRADARPHARGGRLDVHTELFVYAGASRRRYEFLSTWEPFWGPKNKVHSPPLLLTDTTMETRTEQDLCSSDIIIDYLIFGQKKKLLTLEALSELFFIFLDISCKLSA